jgi:hypothetical protein
LVCVDGARLDGAACLQCGEGASCSDDSDCCNDLTCNSGTCGTSTCDETTVCDGECCEGYVCNPDTFLCELEAACGATCPGEQDSECCEGFYCVGQNCIEIPICAPLYCSSNVACCDNKICLNGSGQNPGDEPFSGGSCYVRQGQLCDVNGDQGCETGECIDGYCGGPPECVVEDAACSADSDCCGDLVCVDGDSGKICGVDDSSGGDGDGDGDGGEGTGGEDDGGESPVSLPNTGSGTESGDTNLGRIALIAAAGGAAVIASRIAKPLTSDSDPSS